MMPLTQKEIREACFFLINAWAESLVQVADALHEVAEWYEISAIAISELGGTVRDDEYDEWLTHEWTEEDVNGIDPHKNL